MTRKLNQVKDIKGMSSLVSFGSLLIVGFVAFATWNGIRVAPFLSAADVFLILGGLMLVPVVYYEPSLLKETPGWMWIAMTLILISSLFSVVASGELTENFVGLVRFITAAFGVPIILYLTLRFQNLLQLMINWWLWCCAFNGFIGFSDLVLETSIGYSITGFKFLHYWHRTAGLTTHPNHLGLACLMALPVALVAINQESQLRKKLVWFLVPLGLISGILVSGSRSLLIGGVFCLILLSLFNKEIIKPALQTVILCLSLIGIVEMTSVGKSNPLLLGFERIRIGVLPVGDIVKKKEVRPEEIQPTPGSIRKEVGPEEIQPAPGFIRKETVVMEEKKPFQSLIKKESVQTETKSLESAFEKDVVKSVRKSNESRLEIFEKATGEFLENPLFGVGFAVSRDAHNIYLQFLHAGGIVGFLGFICLMTGYLRLGYILKNEPCNTEPNIQLAEALMVSIVTWLIVGLLFNAIADRYLYIPFGLLLAMQCRTMRVERGGTVATPLRCQGPL